MGTVTFSLRLDEDTKNNLEAEAAREDRSASWLATKAIQMMLEAKAAKRRMVEAAMLEADKGVFIPEDQMNDWFNSIGDEVELPEPEPELLVK